MAKTKPKARILTSDGAGGMVEMQDRRFERGEWPIQFDVPKERADTWLQYLSVECKRRGWSSTSLGQIEAEENSGSITVHKHGAKESLLAVVWERKRGGPLKVRARLEATGEIPLHEAQELFQQVNQLCSADNKERFYFRGQLEYYGLPWRGELWLNDRLRLGPPSRDDETVLISPRVILVDAEIEGIDRSDAASAFKVRLRELSVFLSVVIRREVRPPKTDHVWTSTHGPDRKVECDTRQLGYWEPEHPKELPAKGDVSIVPLVRVTRPDLDPLGRGIRTDLRAQELPADVIDLWQAFARLSPARRRQFLQAGSMWQLALSLGREWQTTGFALMVVACEALKRPDTQFRDHKIYHVVKALLGKPTADRLQEDCIRPQEVRNVNLHSGEFRGSEFVQHMMISSFEDPTFDEAHIVLALITPAAIIEWLTRGGIFTMPPLRRRKKWRRWVKQHTLAILPTLTAAAIVLGWFLRTLWSG